TRSDSAAYAKETRWSCVFRETMSNGIPIGPPFHVPEPKSACTGASSPIEAISRAESRATGSLSMRWFHALLAGKTGQCRADGSRNACADDPARRATANAAETDDGRACIAFASADAFPILSEWPPLPRAG